MDSYGYPGERRRLTSIYFDLYALRCASWEIMIAMRIIATKGAMAAIRTYRPEPVIKLLAER
jgi:hypothetical protein